VAKVQVLMVILYSLAFPTGKRFKADYVKDHADKLKAEGFVDSPALLDLPEPEPELITEEQAEALTPADLVYKCKALGYHVLTDIELEAQVNKSVEEALVQLSAEAEAEASTVTIAGVGVGAPAVSDDITTDDSTNDSEESIRNRFIQSPTSLTKEELVVFGAELGLKLKMTQKEQTMIDLISAHFAEETE